MSNLFRFTILRPVQRLPKERQDLLGFRTHADPANISSWAQNVFDLCNDDDHLEAYNECVTFLKSTGPTGSISSYEHIALHSPILDLAVQHLRKRGRKIDAADFNIEFNDSKLIQYCTIDPGTGLIQYEIDKKLVEDTLFALAFVRNLGNKGNIDYMLVYRANQILNFSFNNGSSVTQQQLDALTIKPILIPDFVYDKCRKKYLTDEPFRYLQLETLPQEPEPLPEPECDCTCEEEGCQHQNSCCAELKPYVADLMIVREELKRYEPKHLAYIENVMAGETRTREHRNLERTETFQETETETTKSVEKDHTVEDRFSLKTEIEKTIQEDLSIDAGVTFKGEFGTTKYATNFGLSYDLSKSESQNIAQEYARNVVTRSVSKVEEKVRELKSVKHISETEETNLHQFTNTGTTKHLVGQYHFVNMINKAQVLNYGKRLMFEFVLPEPMELYKHLLKKEVLPFGLTKPIEPHLRIPQIHPDPFKSGTTPTDQYDDADDYNPSDLYYYQDLIAHFKLTGIEPMPAAEIQIPFSFQNDSHVQSHNQTLSFSVNAATIPSNYKGTSAFVDIKGYDYVNDVPDIGLQMELEWFIDGKHSGLIPQPGPGYVFRTGSTTETDIDVVEGSTLTMVVMTKSSVGIAGTGYIKCSLTEQAIEKWKTSIYEAIMSKYQQDLEEYETARARYDQEKNAKLPFGNNPFINREIERTELKRLAVSYISCQFFDQFTAMKRKVEPCGYPEMDLEQAQKDGSFIQFFEQLFDWNLMTYLFYPYFWGKKCSWPEKVQTNSGDPLFDKALMAGAARVQVPVRLGHEPLALYWTAFGEIWQGQSEPPLPGSDYYVSMVQEIKEQKNHFYTDREGVLETIVGQDWVELSGSGIYWDFTAITPSTPDGVINEEAINADIDREIMINCSIYRIIKIMPGIYDGTDPEDPSSYSIDPTHLTWTIFLDRPLDATTCDGCEELPDATVIPNVKFKTGALFVGFPFEVVVPTNLVFLRNIEDENNPGQYILPNCLPCYPIKC
jgi:hypothetical protein